MKKHFKAFLCLILAVILLSQVPAVSAFAAVKTDSSPAVVTSSIQLSAQTLNSLYKILNVMVDIVNKFIVAFRAPWKTTSTNTVDLSKFTMTFNDEFDSGSLNESIWQNYADGVRDGGYWDKDQAFVQDGNLIIRTEYKEDGTYGPGYYSRRVDTRGRFEQTYGYFECRCILPAAQGLWSAFWMSSTQLGDNVPATQGTEIDVFESPMWYRGLYGERNDLVTSNLHYGGYKLGHRYQNVAVSTAVDPYNSYNTYGVEWNKDEYIFYINGVETGRSSFGGVSQVPEFMELSVEVDGVGGVPYPGWSGLITRNAAGALPADFKVDYVRAYQYKELAG